MRHGITATDLSQEIYTHPSSTEAFNDVLGAVVRIDEREAHRPEARIRDVHTDRRLGTTTGCVLMAGRLFDLVVCSSL
ncbi:hypothetical protein ACIPWY_20870 [Streptomyces sp. NPDC090032]|uniref:hypothetical protein n=1 Tax=Streptomyces sp. NPDC090032 TaxID=3365925 RepID=UPI003807A7C3